MVKIKLFSRKACDISEMHAHGWGISLFTDDTIGGGNDRANIEKKNVTFTVERNGDNIDVKKYVDGVCKDKKMYDPDGVPGIDGILYINENQDPEKVYAFFRNSELQILLDSIGVERMSFRGDDGVKSFDFIRDENSAPEDIVTDGEFSGTRSYHGCTFYLDKKRKELFLLRGKTIKEVESKLL